MFVEENETEKRPRHGPLILAVLEDDYVDDRVEQLLKDVRLLLVDEHERRGECRLVAALLTLLLLLLLGSLLFAQILEEVGDDVIESRATARAYDRVQRAQTVRDRRQHVHENLRFQHAYERHVIRRQRLQQTVVGLTQLGIHLFTSHTHTTTVLTLV